MTDSSVARSIMSAAVAGLIAVWSGPAMTAPPSRPTTPAMERGGNVDHRYRIRGRIRVLLFWIGSDDVGSARITWRQTDEGRAVALLIGSDPGRAPRRVNEWGYIREGTRSDSTSVFGIRTLSDGDSPGDAEARRNRQGGFTELGILCSNVSPAGVHSRTATAFVSHGATYRDIDPVLDVVEQELDWKHVQIRRPADSAPGFLTALDRMMRSTVAAWRGGAALGPSAVAYTYKDAVFELRIRRLQPIAELMTASGPRRNLLRAEMAVTNRSTGSTSGFAITYGTEGRLGAVPVVLQYQPNWWLKVELELDERADAPPDPADDPSIKERIGGLCRQRSETQTSGFGSHQSSRAASR